ncbi:L,D-transpeptidase family protein [Thioalkalicoccus limnaeus]|uniref:L,D-transpeptidase family protein n=1 Tax=Thioalkalicoccus limnaeus TaxID=120681 RepID=A0ABV4BBD7_9GAMM
MAKEPMPEPEPDLEQMLVLASAYERLMADLVVVEKSKRRLYLLKDDRPFRSYPISLGFAPEGHKEQKGDGRTPEGRYYLNWRQYSNNFYRSIHISYPNEEDRLNAAREGNDPGGMIMIHGQPRSNAHRELQEILRSEDWTRGCIAVSDSAIDEIWKATRNGTPIEIRP